MYSIEIFENVFSQKIATSIELSYQIANYAQIQQLNYMKIGGKRKKTKRNNKISSIFNGQPQYHKRYKNTNQCRCCSYQPNL